MEQVPATRAELLARKNQITLASQGRNLLKEKRNALWKELMETANKVLQESDMLESSAGRAVASLALAEALDGPEQVKSAAFAARRQVNLDVQTMNIMGVTVPRFGKINLSRAALNRGYSLNAVSGRIDAAAEAFEELLAVVLEVAEMETRLRRLGEEIRQTTRRVNALEHVLIPRLEAQKSYIEMTLDEYEREELFRLKRVQVKLAAKRGQSG